MDPILCVKPRRPEETPTSYLLRLEQRREELEVLIQAAKREANAARAAAVRSAEVSSLPPVPSLVRSESAKEEDDTPRVQMSAAQIARFSRHMLMSEFGRPSQVASRC